ncbi:unnamed protein product [marine sediment metagenome]|uniref:Uncharacterized protein n=1 Tax=marine sediment metagenome TaxID=412755 RepID=X1MLV8_9ZZZZ
MSISDACFNVATPLFRNWMLIDAAKRYASVEQRPDALAATINARASVYDAGSVGVLTEEEVKAINGDLEGIANAIRDGLLPTAKKRLEDLSEQTFMHALEKVVQCECSQGFNVNSVS